LKIVRNVSCAVNQHIRMISEGSRDSFGITEINYILKYIKIESKLFQIDFK